MLQHRVAIIISECIKDPPGVFGRVLVRPTARLQYLWWVPGRGGGGLVVMEDHHDEEPVAAEEVPGHPVHRIGVEDGGQDKQVDDNHHRGGEQNHQSHKDLREREKTSG